MLRLIAILIAVAMIDPDAVETIGAEYLEA